LTVDAAVKHPGGRPRKEINLDELKRLLEEGRSLRQIAAELGRGYGTVRRAAQALDHGRDEPKLPQVSQNHAA
jgi:uncharacterized protein YerC